MTTMDLLGTLGFVRREARASRAAAGMLCATLALSVGALAEKPREKLLAAKQAAYDANFRNDAPGL